MTFQKRVYSQHEVLALASFEVFTDRFRSCLSRIYKHLVLTHNKVLSIMSQMLEVNNSIFRIKGKQQNTKTAEAFIESTFDHYEKTLKQ